MKLFAKTIEARLLANGRNRDRDHAPVVKIFNPCGSATWLLSELDQDGILFGLCDLGMGSPELGSVGRDDLETFRNNQTGLGLERDLYFGAVSPMSVYAEAARISGRIVDTFP